FVLRGRDGGSEGPVDAGPARLERGDVGYLGDEREIPSSAEADTLRKDDGIAHVVVSVNGIDAVHERDSGAARLSLEALYEGPPGRGGVVRRGIGAPPAEYGSEL